MPYTDGCSVPKALRIFIPHETQAQTDVCNAHDDAYDKGGTRRDRAVADGRLLLGLLETGMDVDLAERYHTCVRLFGKDHWFGGIYTDDLPPVPGAQQAP
jgi:hypothetical protein